MVCLQYSDARHLLDECIDGKQLGFTGKQAIHPSQVEIIQDAFAASRAGLLQFDSRNIQG
jgi:citrate lyase beta subunit